MASLLTLPTEILYAIMKEAAPDWKYGDVAWFLELRLTNRTYSLYFVS